MSLLIKPLGINGLNADLPSADHVPLHVCAQLLIIFLRDFLSLHLRNQLLKGGTTAGRAATTRTVKHCMWPVC